MNADPATMNSNETTARVTEPLTAEFAHLVAAGSKALVEGELEAARTSFEAAATQYPDEPVGHNNLGAFYMGLGELTAAETCFERVTQLVPDRANSYFNLALSRFRQDKYGEAAAGFAEAAALTPDDPEVLNNLGAAHFMAGELTEARQGFMAALTVQPNFPNAVLNLCDVDLMEGNPDAARDLCEAYLQYNHDLGVLRRLLELLDNEARDAVEDAIPRAEALIAANEEDKATRRHLGRLLEARQALTAEA